MMLITAELQKELNAETPAAGVTGTPEKTQDREVGQGLNAEALKISLELVQQSVTQRVAAESEGSVKKILNAPQFVASVSAAVSDEWESQEEQTKQKLDMRMKALDDICEQLKEEQDAEKKAELLLMCKQEEKLLQVLLH